MDIFGILDPDPHENLCGSETLVCMCGSGYVFGIRIRIHEAPEYGSNTDPDPQHWLKSRIWSRPKSSAPAVTQTTRQVISKKKLGGHHWSLRNWVATPDHLEIGWPPMLTWNKKQPNSLPIHKNYVIRSSLRLVTLHNLNISFKKRRWNMLLWSF